MTVAVKRLIIEMTQKHICIVLQKINFSRMKLIKKIIKLDDMVDLMVIFSFLQFNKCIFLNPYFN